MQTLSKLTLAALLFSTPVLAQGVIIGPGGVEVQPPYREYNQQEYHQQYYHHHRGGVDCAELRAACLHKEELGEEGQGNCQRYRTYCRGYH
jgi:hypothetical protein